MLAVKGIVFDVSAGRGFYGKGGGYEMLAGRDASRALAKMSMGIADVDNPSVDDLDERQRLSLDSWGWSASRPRVVIHATSFQSAPGLAAGWPEASHARRPTTLYLALRRSTPNYRETGADDTWTVVL